MGRLTRRWHPFAWGRAVGVDRLIQTAALALMATTAGAQARTLERRVPVEYPALAIRMRVAGTVTVLTEIDADGNVTDAKATAGHALLRQPAEKSVLHWKFAAAAKPSSANVNVRFDLDTASAH